MDHFRASLKTSLTMNESKKILEYFECDLEFQERLTEIKFDQHLLTTWHCLAEVNKIGEGNAPSSSESFLLTAEPLPGREF